jgi:hypothetical protein
VLSLAGGLLRIAGLSRSESRGANYIGVTPPTMWMEDVDKRKKGGEKRLI